MWPACRRARSGYLGRRRPWTRRRSRFAVAGDGGQSKRRRAPVGADVAEPLQGIRRRHPGSADAEGGRPLSAAPRPARGRHRRPPDPTRAGQPRAATPRQSRDEARRPRLGRGCAAVPAPAARLRTRSGRRRLRTADSGRCSARPARARARCGRCRRTADGRCPPGPQQPGEQPDDPGEHSHRPGELPAPGVGADRRRLRRPALGRPAPPGDRLPGRLRHPCGGGGRGHDHLRYQQLRRLREPRGDPAPARLHDLVRPPREHHNQRRAERGGGHGDRPRRVDRLLDRPPSALRGPALQHADRPGADAAEHGRGAPERRARRARA